MYAPVNQSTAHRNRLCGERAAEARNGTVCTEAGMYMVDIAELAVVDILFDKVNAVIEAVNNTDIEHLAGSRAESSASQGLPCRFLQLASRTERSYLRAMRQWKWSGEHCSGCRRKQLQLPGLPEHRDNPQQRCRSRTFQRRLCALRDDVGRILDFCLRVVHVRRCALHLRSYRNQ